MAVNQGRSPAHNGRLEYGAEERRLWALVLGAVFYVATVFILNFGEPPLDIRVGEVARRDYRARVTFSCRDLEATEQQRTRKADREPNVYRFSPETLDSTRNACLAALRKLLLTDHTQGPEPAEKSKEVAEAPASPVETHTKLTDVQLAALRSALTPLGDSAAEALKRLFADPSLTIVIRNQDYENEINQYDHLWVNMILNVKEPAKRLSIYDTIPLDTKLPSVLESLVSREFKEMRPEDQKLLNEFLLERFRDPTLQYSEKDTKEAREKARAQVEPIKKTINQGETILPAGSIATEARILELDAERHEFFGTQPLSARVKRIIGSALLLGLIFAGFGMYLYGLHGRALRAPRRLACMGALCLVMIIMGKALAYTGWSVLLVPVPFVAVTFSLIYNQRIAIGAASLLATVLAIISGLSFSTFLVLVGGGLVAGLSTTGVRTRTKLVNVGLLSGLAQACAVWAVNLAGDASIGADFWRSVTFMDSMIALGNGILSGFLITGLLPFLERAFGIVTEISLLEWADVNRPVLRRLILEAPGTYHHSVLVGNLAEAAAQTIGANTLLARTTAYYHDIGKLVKPEYFVENDAEAPQRHAKLSPALSALIITAHTRDGAQMADQYRIPGPIRDVIEEHHGTTLVEYFYNAAIQQAGGDGKVDPECFRYRGPKPQTCEASIVLLADAVESASRVMSEPTASRIDSLVREITQRRLADGQFDDCSITLKELRKVEQSLVRELTAMFHTRIRYPRL
jgi:putative nucleotidyltransferase with HDIG domain